MPPRVHRPRNAATIPRATYRLQLNRDFTFGDAAAIVPYLADLGVSHVYCSPYFRTRPGSMHGYDVVAHDELNPEIGSRADLEHFAAVLRAHGLGQILDIVPNHVGVFGAENERWMDVLENGRASIFADWFDIDWQGLNPVIPAKLVVPLLGDHYGRVLESGELEPRFEREKGAFAVWYHEHRLPIDPCDYPRLLGRALTHPRVEGRGTVARAQLEALAADFAALPSREETDAERIAARHRDKEPLKTRLAAVYAAEPAIAEALEAALGELRGTPGDVRSFDALDELLESQCYRLAYWRVAGDEINYRRFFDVNDLAALRMENETVFEATHRLVFELIEAGIVQGLRIDHPDGLYDPAQYFERLQRRAEALEGTMSLYVVAEKITAAHERLPPSWLVHGTTGYRFGHLLDGLCTDGASRGRMLRTWRGFTGDATEWPDVLHDAKRLVLATTLTAELNVLANQLLRIAAADRRTRDFTRASLREALAEVIACFPVYRTYLDSGIPESNERYIEWAIAQARRRSRAADPSIFGFVHAALRGELLKDAPDPWPQAVRAFARKFQQITAPVTAKGMEDTAFYRWFPLASLNEVGGDPTSIVVSLRAFHADCRERAQLWPHGLLAGSTHDSKRSEDVRTRIDVLSEMPAQWRQWLSRWSRLNRSRKREVEGVPAPSRADEYLLYQTLLGSWPHERPDDAALDAYRERIERYMVKAAREAKRHTSWINVHEAYEEALAQFVRALLERRPGNLFLEDFEAQQPRIAWFGALNSLTQTLLRLTAPGVPDIYRGTELFDLSLVDPDNRRPVDFEHRRRLLAEVGGWAALPSSERTSRLRELYATLGDGRAKLYLIACVLALRREREALFRDGEYLPLRAAGARAAHICAFARRLGSELTVVIAPRLYARLLDGQTAPPLGEAVWADTSAELPAALSGAREMVNVLDGARVSVEMSNAGEAGVIYAGAALANFPVALLVAEARS